MPADAAIEQREMRRRQSWVRNSPAAARPAL